MAERITIARPYAKAVFKLAQQPEAHAAVVRGAGHRGQRGGRSARRRAARQSRGQSADAAGRAGDRRGRRRAWTSRPAISSPRSPPTGASAYLPEIAARYEQLRADAERTVEVTVTSAVELSAAQKARYSRRAGQAARPRGAPELPDRSEPARRSHGARRRSGDRRQRARRACAAGRGDRELVPAA